MKPRISMRDALADDKLLGNVLKAKSRYGWRILLIEELTEEERVEFKRLTGHEREPGNLVKEFVCVSGAGGSRYCLLYAMPAP